MKHFIAFAVGLIFGIGLLISGMTQPEKIFGFLDIFGRWDPSLAFVMAGALIIAAVGFVLAERRGKSLLGNPLTLPQQSEIDPRLLGGALIFGVGWGLAGVCPAPAIVNLGFASAPAYILAGAMLAGMAIYGFTLGRNSNQ